jgi:hypothetical protein
MSNWLKLKSEALQKNKKTGILLKQNVSHVSHKSSIFNLKLIQVRELKV